jgi:pyruvate, water dikinase
MQKTDQADNSANLARAHCVLSAVGPLADRMEPLLEPGALPGARRGRFHFPHISGIASSLNPYVWSEYVSAADGHVRLVFGLGSRLQDRSGEDFARLVPLSAPNRRPEVNLDEVARYSQRKADVFDIESNRTVTAYFDDLVPDLRDVPFGLFTTEGEHENPLTGKPVRLLTLDPLLSRTPLVFDLKAALPLLRDALGHEMEIEFAADFGPGAGYRFLLTGCRLLPRVPFRDFPAGDRLLEGAGAVLGSSRVTKIDRVIYVSQKEYGLLGLRERYDVARGIGKVNRLLGDRQVLLIGPGRWATSSPELGVPVAFGEINRAIAVVEVVAMREHLVPDVSRGSHLLNELVAKDMVYLAMFPGRVYNALDSALLEAAPNRLLELVPDAGAIESVLRVVDAGDLAGEGRSLSLFVDTEGQHAACMATK